MVQMAVAKTANILLNRPLTNALYAKTEVLIEINETWPKCYPKCTLFTLLSNIALLKSSFLLANTKQQKFSMPDKIALLWMLRSSKT